MIAWLPIVAVALAAFLALVALRAPRVGWEALAAALLIGLAGYGWQGHPGLAGSPAAGSADAPDMASGMVAERLLLAGDAGQGDKHLIIADALTRHGQYADAITVLRGATDADPKDSQAWLAMANALVAKAEGNLSPAALLAFRRAAETDPRAPGPPYFLGLALARSGRFEEARGLWLNVVQNAPANAPWRDHIAQRILRLDRLIVLARQMQAQH